MAIRGTEEYVAFGERALIELVRAEGAVLLEKPKPKSQTFAGIGPTPVNPHHLTTARQRLLARNWITLSEPFDVSGTRLMLPVDTTRKKELIRVASKRKRALHTSMESWGRATNRYPSSIIGAAGERVVRASLVAAATHGIRPVIPDAQEIPRLFGEPVAGGPLDAAVWADQQDDLGRASGSVLCPVEVKNIRHWIYPTSHELFQLLHKSALLQQSHPELAICPILVTRQRSWTADRMSRDLGFRILDLHKQFVLPIADVPETQVDAICAELGYDLVRTDDPDPTLTKLARESLRLSAQRNAERWRDHGSLLADHYEALRDAALSGTARDDAMTALRDEADDNGSRDGPW